MLISYLHLFFLIIAPQLWFTPLLGLPIDYLLISIWLFYLVLSSKIFNFRIGPQEVFLFSWFLWIVFSIGINGYFFNQTTVIVYYVKCIILYILLSSTLKGDQDIHKYTCFFLILSLIMAVEGIYHHYHEIGWAGQDLGWISGGGTGRTRWVGIFDGPGVFCVIYTIALPFLLPALSRDRNFFSRVASFFALLLLLIAIYFNGSRGGLLTTVAIFGLKCLLTMHIKAWQLLVVGVATICFFAVAPTHITQLSDPERSSSHRVEMWAAGCEMLKLSPIFGIGRGNFADYTGKLVAHNSAVEIMGETGIVGLFLLIGTIYFGIKAVRQRLSENVEDTQHPLGTTQPRIDTTNSLLLSIIGYIVSSLFVTLEYETFYLLLALPSALSRQLINPLTIEFKDLRNILAIELAWVGFINGFTKFIGPGAFL